MPTERIPIGIRSVGIPCAHHHDDCEDHGDDQGDRDDRDSCDDQGDGDHDHCDQGGYEDPNHQDQKMRVTIILRYDETNAMRDTGGGAPPLPVNKKVRYFLNKHGFESAVTVTVTMTITNI